MEQPAAAGQWWRGAVLYQLYVRSWRDADGDGHGDLRGIIERLDHLAWLGVDALWLSPTMPSPDADWGYDVSDYTGVHPGLGTMADLEALIEQAGRRSIRVLLDLAPNHTSSAHPWFIDALSGPDAAHRGYYVWADPAPGGGPPNNWLDCTGQPAWQLDRASGQYYLHNFLAAQPDLNWWNPAVHREFAGILQFWFDRGVAGFRIDVAHGLYKDAQLRDNPPLDGSDPLAGQFGQRPAYSANRPQVHGVYRDWRAIAGRYSPERLLLGETWVGDAGRLASFYGAGDELQLAFNFPFVFAEFTARQLAAVVARTLAALPAGACPVWMASNHDVGRFPTRWCGGDQRKIRLALLLLATLPGATVLYYGDEIGMAEVSVPRELRRDAMTLDADDRGSRDRARTPLRWDATAGAGFTAPGVTPWLPFGPPSAGGDPAGADLVATDPASTDPAGTVAGQRADENSTLWFCRRLLALRRAERRPRRPRQLGRGRPGPGQASPDQPGTSASLPGYRQLPAPDGLWAYQCGGLTVTANLTDRSVAVPAERAAILLATPGAPAPGRGAPAPGRGGLVLPPWSGVIARGPA